MRRPLNNTTKLPRGLQDELGIGFDGSSLTIGKQVVRSRRHGVDRKDRRRAERENKKKKPQRTSFRPRPSRSDVARRDVEDEESVEEDDDEGPTTELHLGEQSDKAKEPARLKSILKKAEKSADILPATETMSAPPTRLSRGQRDRFAQDEAEIAALEKKLGMKGKKKLPKAFEEDGLDELLEGLDRDVSDGEEKLGKRKRTEEQEWLEAKRKKARGSPDASSGLLMSSMGHDESDSDDFGNVDVDLSDVASEGHAGGSPNSFEDFDEDGSSSRPAKPSSQRENPYVAPRTTASSEPPSKYVPPSLRTPAAASDTSPRLRRQVQGLLNRLSEANLLAILSEVETLYRNNPRQHVTSTLQDILLSLVGNHASLNDTFLILHAGFIAAVYKVIGTDFGAVLVQQAVEHFDRHGSDENDGKESNNLISLLAQLYNFQVVGSNLIFDFIRAFLDELSETNTELLLKIIRISGPQLRQDDPSALKDIVLMLQPAIIKRGETNLNVRTKFMIETINNLKNNRMKTGMAASTLLSESTVRMKKILGSLNTRNIRGGEPMRVGLRDIREGEKKGKWWLVGASWKGKDDREEDITRHVDDGRDDVESINDGQMDLLQLAKEQRMNTDIRRAIFISIMSATDFRDAHVRLTKLRLKKAQELEIPRVLIHCSGAEQVYNPYYTLIARRLCGEHKLRIAFQFGLWDLFKGMGEGDVENEVGRDLDDDEAEVTMGMRKMVNLAKMYGSLIADGCLGLNVLKNLNLGYLQPKTKTFLELLFITVVSQSQQKAGGERDEQTIATIFHRLKDQPAMVRGLQYFLKKIVYKTTVAGGKPATETVKWGCRIADDVLKGIISQQVIKPY